MSGTRIENISRFIKMNSFPFHLNYTRKFVIYLELILIIETHYLQRYLITRINFNNIHLKLQTNLTRPVISKNLYTTNLNPRS